MALSQLRGRRTSFPEEGNSCRELCGLQSAMDAAQMQMVTILYYGWNAWRATSALALPCGVYRHREKNTEAKKVSLVSVSFVVRCLLWASP